MDVFTNGEIAQRLTQQSLPEPWDGKHPLTITTAGGNTTIEYIGEKQVGDKTIIQGDVIGSAVGRGASVNARDISVYNGSLDASTALDVDLKATPKKARQAIEELQIPQTDKDDLVDDLGKLTDEAMKPKPEEGRLKRLWGHIKEVAPTVATILQSAESLRKLMDGG